MQSIKVKGQLVEKEEWKQTDGHDRLHYLATMTDTSAPGSLVKVSRDGSSSSLADDCLRAPS